MIEIDWEPLNDLLRDGMEQCTIDQWAESGRDHHDVPLAVDWPLYKRLEAAGIFRLLGARIDGELVGYSALYFHPHAMYCTTMHVINDSIYVKPKHRGIGPRLVRVLEEKLEGMFPNQNVRVIYCAQVGDRWKDALNKMGYLTTETVQTKVLNL